MQKEEFTYAYYEKILFAALRLGYDFISYEQFSKKKYEQEKICLLRHDCDNDLPAALRMAEIEHQIGIASTYFFTFHAEMYNLQSVSNVTMARQILSLGHHAGLHFDHNFYADANDNEITDLVEKERRQLVSLLDVPVNIMSFHQPSERVLRQEIKVDMMNTYDRNDMRDAFYISDSNMVWRGRPPHEVFMSGEHPHIHLLIHPEWWADENAQIAERWARMFADNFDSQQKTLIKLEKSYIKDIDIIFEPQ